MRNSKSRIAVLATLVLAFVCSIVLSVFSFAFATTEAKTIDQVSIYMKNGAGVRVATSADNMGLRFTSLMYKSEYDALMLNEDYDKVEFGMVIVPADYVELEPLTEASLFGIGGEKKYQWTNKDNDVVGQEYIINLVTDKGLSAVSGLTTQEGFEELAVVGFQGSITNIKNGENGARQNIDREFVAASYIKVTPVEGEVQYKLSASNIDENEMNLLAPVDGTDGTISRSVAEVAFQTVNDENRQDEKYAAENAAIRENYLEKCKYDIVVMDGEQQISEEKVAYGSSYKIQVPEKAANYKFREVLVSFKDEKGNDAPTTIEKVTAKATYTAVYEKEVVIIDATDGANNWANTSATNKAMIVTTNANKARFGAEDKAMAIKKTESGTKTLYNYFDFSTIRKFDEVTFNVKFGPLADANAWVSTYPSKVTLGVGLEGNKVEITDVQNWNEIKMVQVSSTTMDIYLNGVKVVTAGTFEANGASKMLIKFEWCDGSNYGLIFSDFVAKNYEKEGKSLVIYNNGGANVTGETDVFEYVDNGKTYTLDSLMNTEKTAYIFKAGYGTNGLVANGYWAGGANGGVLGYKYKGAEIGVTDTITVNEDTVFEAVTTNTDVILDLDNSRLGDTETDETESVNKLYIGEGENKDWTFNNSNTVLTLSKVEAALDRNQGYARVALDNTETASKYPNIYFNTRFGKENSWFEYDVIYLRFNFVKQCLKGIKVGETWVQDFTWQTDVVFKFVKSADAHQAGGLTINKFNCYYISTSQTTWKQVGTAPVASLGSYSTSGAFFQLQTVANKKVSINIANVYGYKLPVTTAPVEA